MSRILIVDDDVEIAELVSDSLMGEGFQTQIAHSGDEAFGIINDCHDYSMIILDIMMPGMDGLTLCRKIRDEIQCPIIFISAKNRPMDTILGFEMGADDYIKKPFVVEELISRVKAHLRREHRKDTEQGVGNELVIGDIVIFKDRYEVTHAGVSIGLTTREFQLLCYLAENAGKVLSKNQIFDAVWGENYGDINTVTVNIKNLRTKMDPESNHIITVWGVGYKFVI